MLKKALLFCLVYLLKKNFFLVKENLKEIKNYFEHNFYKPTNEGKLLLAKFLVRLPLSLLLAWFLILDLDTHFKDHIPLKKS